MTTESKREMVRLEKVTKRFGDFTALNGVDISVTEGEVVAHHRALRLR